MDSILTSIKKLLQISEEDDSFDVDVIMHINSVFFDLHQIGVGPSECFSIEDADAFWEDFISSKEMEAIKTYMYLKVKLLFDPPTNSSVLESYTKSIEKLEFRLNIAAESKKE